MRSIKCILFLALSLQTVQAADSLSVSSGPYQTAVVELYTSEGCSSCPPADRWLDQLIQLPTGELDVLALAFHVDYWDHLGWKDQFASPRYSARQRELGRFNRQQTIYTPGFFVDGREIRGTSNILASIRRTNRTSASVDLELKSHIDNGQLRMQLTSRDNSRQNPRVQFVLFEDNLSTRVDRGENAGHQLSHQRVVRYLSPPINLQPELSHDIRLDPAWKRNDLGIAALVTTPEHLYLQAVYTGLD